MTSPDDDTIKDSVRAMAIEQRPANGSRRRIRLDPFAVEIRLGVVTAFVGFIAVLGDLDGDTGMGFSKPSRPLLAGADSALLLFIIWLSFYSLLANDSLRLKHSKSLPVLN